VISPPPNFSFYVLPVHSCTCSKGIAVLALAFRDGSEASLYGRAAVPIAQKAQNDKQDRLTSAEVRRGIGFLRSAAGAGIKVASATLMSVGPEQVTNPVTQAR
jgi:hypothetical protein